MAIPKIIHYCWFGRKEKPQDVLRYLQNWRDTLPDYQIVEWNESNFDISCYAYVEEAYAAKKYAFVSDVARLHALLDHGGIYMDTDVQVIRPFDDLLEGGVVTGFEEFNYVATSTLIAPPSSKLIKSFLRSYEDRHFLDAEGKLDMTTNVEVLTRILETCGLQRNGHEQSILFEGEVVRILAQTKFSPMDYPNRIINADHTTYTIHHFGQSWTTSGGKAKKVAKHLLISLIGGERLRSLRKLVGKSAS